MSATHPSFRPALLDTPLGTAFLSLIPVFVAGCGAPVPEPGSLAERAPAPGVEVAAPACTDDRCAPDVVDLQLDPNTLVFADSPIEHLLGVEYVVSGFDPDQETCVLLAYNLQLSSSPSGAHCDDHLIDSVQLWTLPSEAPCEAEELYYQWPLYEVLGAEGCVEFSDFHAGAYDLIDVIYKVRNVVSNPDTVLTLAANNRATYDPPLVTLGLNVESDVPVDVFVPWSVGGTGQHVPEFMQVWHEGIDEMPDLFDGCWMNFCDEPDPQPCQSFDYRGQNVAYNHRDRLGASTFLNWDGKVRYVDGDAGCWRRQTLEHDELRVSLCYGFERGEDLQIPDLGCWDMPLDAIEGRATLQVQVPSADENGFE